MEDKLNILWTKRKNRQKYPLIGSSNKNDSGNGYHDRIGFSIPYHLLNFERNRYNNWLYSVYFRDLINFIDPSLKVRIGKVPFAINIKNCSENYENTFLKYLSDDWYNDILLTTIGKWAQELVHTGRLILEFVSWYDREEDFFYGYELKIVDSNFSKLKKSDIIFEAPTLKDNNELEKKSIKIPLSKCIVVEWPKELGGIKSYEDIVSKVLELGDKHDGVSQSIDKPISIIEKMEKWDTEFYKLTNLWGHLHPPEKTTEFFKNSNFFNLKGTIIYITYALIGGLEQLTKKLNSVLDENARIEYNPQDYDVTKYLNTRKRWFNGELSFKEANEYLRF